MLSTAKPGQLDRAASDEILSAPDCFPVAWNDLDDRIRFRRVNRETFRSSRFVGDLEFMREMPLVGSIAIGDILARNIVAERNTTSRHYVFHLAYCCSTLLANYFGNSEKHLVIKEPSVLSYFAVKARDMSPSDEMRLTAITWLLGRVYPDQVTALIKSNVLENTIARDILRLDAAATSTFVVQSLEECVASIIKQEWRINKVREWNRNLYRRAFHNGRSLMKSDVLDDVQTAAFWWIENMKLAIDLRTSFPTRVLIVTAGDIAERATDVLAGIARLPGIDGLGAVAEDIALCDVAKRYSKDAGRSYDSQDRRKEIKMLLDRYTAETQQARLWLEDRFPEEIDRASHLAECAL